MDFLDDDEDLFYEEPSVETSIPHNPIEENLMNQLNTVQEQIRIAQNETVQTQELTDRILDKLFQKCLYLRDESSDSETELYDETGAPVAKKKCKRNNQDPLLIIDDIWHRIIDHKWIIGINLINNSKQILRDPMIYISLKDEDELTGITSFWEMDMDSSSTTKTNEIGQTRDCQTIGIVILDIPCFKNSSCAIGFGTITFSIEGKNLQSPIPMFKLDASQAIVKILTPRYADNIDYSILAIKSSSIEKIFKLPMKNGVGDKLLTYLADKDFVESRPDVYASKNPESFRYCLVEFIMQEFVDGINIKIYTRTTSQQNAMMHMFQTEFPEIIEIDKDEKIKEAAMILEREIDLRINSNNNCKILAAKITTDLFIQ